MLHQEHQRHNATTEDLLALAASMGRGLSATNVHLFCIWIGH